MRGRAMSKSRSQQATAIRAPVPEMCQTHSAQLTSSNRAISSWARPCHTSSCPWGCTGWPSASCLSIAIHCSTTRTELCSTTRTSSTLRCGAHSTGRDQPDVPCAPDIILPINNIPAHTSAAPDIMLHCRERPHHSCASSPECRPESRQLGHAAAVTLL